MASEARRWVITGGSSGMGLELARSLRENGEHVEVWDRADCPLDGVEYHEMDLMDVASIRAAASASEDAVDVLAHCAGAMFDTEVSEPGAGELLQRATALHAGGLVEAVHALYGRLTAASSAHIVAISSIADEIVYPGSLAYGSSKAALDRVIQQLAVDLGPDGIAVNGISPGAIRTPLSEGFWKDDAWAARRLQTIPLRRAGTPADICEVAWFLGTCSYVSGVVIPVDGGFRLGFAPALLAGTVTPSSD